MQVSFQGQRNECRPYSRLILRRLLLRVSLTPAPSRTLRRSRHVSAVSRSRSRLTASRHYCQAFNAPTRSSDTIPNAILTGPPAGRTDSKNLAEVHWKCNQTWERLQVTHRYALLSCQGSAPCRHIRSASAFAYVHRVQKWPSYLVGTGSRSVSVSTDHGFMLCICQELHSRHLRVDFRTPYRGALHVLSDSWRRMAPKWVFSC